MNGKEIREKTNSNLKQIQLNKYHEKSSIHYTVHLEITITHHKYSAWIYSLFLSFFGQINSTKCIVYISIFPYFCSLLFFFVLCCAVRSEDSNIVER